MQTSWTGSVTHKPIWFFHTGMPLVEASPATISPLSVEGSIIPFEIDAEGMVFSQSFFDQVRDLDQEQKSMVFCRNTKRCFKLSKQMMNFLWQAIRKSGASEYDSTQSNVINFLNFAEGRRFSHESVLTSKPGKC